MAAVETPVSPAATVLAGELLTAINSIKRAGRVAGRPVELSQLTGSQLDLLRLVRRRPGVSVAEAAAELRLAANSVSTLVRQLVDAGLLVRSADPADRRIAQLRLAPNMQRKVDSFRDRRVALLARAISELTPADRGRVVGLAELLGTLAVRIPQLAAGDE
jgi:DNA-binding MarR family transcriptional regulator